MLASLIVVSLSCSDGQYRVVSGREFRSDVAKTIKPGMTATEVRRLLREPARVKRISKNEELWRYEMTLERSSFLSVLVRMRTSTVHVHVQEQVSIVEGRVVAANLAISGPE